MLHARVVHASKLVNTILGQAAGVLTAGIAGMLGGTCGKIKAHGLVFMTIKSKLKCERATEGQELEPVTLGAPTELPF